MVKFPFLHDPLARAASSSDKENHIRCVVVVTRRALAGLLATGLCLLLAPSANAFTHGDIQSESLIGWTSDGKFIAVEKSYGYRDFENADRNWKLKFIVVTHVRRNRIKAIYRIDQSSMLSDDTSAWFEQLPRERTRALKKALKRARSYSEWIQFSKKHPFSKPDPFPPSPSRRWSVLLDSSDERYAVKTTTVPFDEADDTFTVECQGVGVPMLYALVSEELDAFTSGLMLSVFATDGHHRVAVGQNVLESTESGVVGRVRGCLSTYWGPNERSVAVQWIWAPIIEGPTSSEILFKHLPPLSHGNCAHNRRSRK